MSVKCTYAAQLFNHFLRQIKQSITTGIIGIASLLDYSTKPYTRVLWRSQSAGLDTLIWVCSNIVTTKPWSWIHCHQVTGLSFSNSTVKVKLQNTPRTLVYLLWAKGTQTLSLNQGDPLTFLFMELAIGLLICLPANVTSLIIGKGIVPPSPLTIRRPPACVVDGSDVLLKLSSAQAQVARESNPNKKKTFCLIFIFIFILDFKFPWELGRQVRYHPKNSS